MTRKRRNISKKGKQSTKNSYEKTCSTFALNIEEVIEVVFSYLDYKTLCVVKDVSSLWQKKAFERLSKIYPPFCADIPVLYCEDNDHLLHIQEDCIENNPAIYKLLLSEEPEYAMIIFTNGGFPKEFPRVEIFLSDNLENVAEDYLKFLPYESIAVREFIYVDDRQIKGEENLMTAFHFPKIPSIKITSAIVTETSMDDEYFDNEDPLLALFDIEDSLEKDYCLIILGLVTNDIDDTEKSDNFIKVILDHLKLISQTPRKLTVWGGANVEIRHSHIEPDSENIQWHLINIVGITSHSIALNLDSTEESFKKKLNDFKNRITLKKNSFAFAITHTNEYVTKTEKKDEILKKVLWFKDIFNMRLTTIIALAEDHHCTPVIFCNPSDNANLIIENQNFNTVGYLIINT